MSRHDRRAADSRERRLNKRLQLVFDKGPERTFVDRYVAMGTGEPDGAWAVFDHGQKRFLTADEVLALSSEELKV